MVDNQLNVTSSSGQQTITQSPQTAGAVVNTGSRSSSVQPGTATALLNNQGGVPLGGTTLSTVSLSGGSTVATVQPVAKPTLKREVNPVLFGLPVLFIVVAVVLFWATSRSEKLNTIEL